MRPVPEIIPPTGEIPLEALRRPMRRFYEAWCAGQRDRGGRLPDRRRLDPTFFREAFGNIIVLDPILGGRDFKFRLYGTKVAEGHGADMTGRRVTELPVSSAAIVLPLYRRVMEERTPLYCRLETGSAVVVRIWERLIVPLAEDGETVDRLMATMLPVCYRREWDRIYPGHRGEVRVAF